MTKKLALVAGVGIVLAVAAIVWARNGSSPHRSRVDTNSVHATGIDQMDSSVSLMTMLRAPDGATPCETAYNALEAEQAAARLRNSKSMFKWVAAKPEFLTACRTLSAQAQQCMAPRYRRDHDDCALARPPDAELHKMFIPEPVVEEKPHGEH